MSAIPKAYEPQAVEDKWYRFWLDQKCFVADPARVSEKRPAYSIVIPPPNVTGVLTLGHVLNNTIQDILARKARMEGKEVLWLPGTDHAGIATEAVVVRTLKKAGEIKHRDDISREQFLEKVWEWKEKHGGIIIQQLKKLGASCDWTRERFTMDSEYSRCVQRVFVNLYRKGLIYRGKRMVNWDPQARTALSDEEVIMTEERGHLWQVRYPLLDAKGEPQPEEVVIVATTRPETMLGDEAVAVNPNDERYKRIIGRNCLLPLRNKAIPIIGDELVDPKFGTGCVKVTPAHDPADYEMALRHKLPLTVVIGPDGRMTAEAGEDFEGLDRFEARKAVVEELEEEKFLVKVEEYIHNVGYSERTHVPIEPYLSEQWFLKYPSVEQAKACVAPEQGSARAPRAAVGAPADGLDHATSSLALDVVTRSNAADGASAAARKARALPDEMRFYPQRWAKTYWHWMENIKDWCISRQLWWGHRIPVWYNEEGRQKLHIRVPIIEIAGTELDGANIRELRAAAWNFAKTHHL
ncbi:MAG: class I tRNA ligase family protein, partial [Verrucomicrobiales bacterium]|nr:class I tRNA ligase family protein [Verrucomicrobiales bacterium]